MVAIRKLFIIAVSLMTLALAASPAFADEFPTGSYTIKVGEQSATLRFADGKFTLLLGTEEKIHGTYETKDDQITLTDKDGDGAGKGDKASGTYSWKYADDALTFTMVKDAASGRVSVMTAGPWKKD